MPASRRRIGRFQTASSFPKMVGNLFWEHGHRMVATTVGMLTIALTIFILAKEKRQWVRRLGIFALLAVIAQGLLGGLTVKLMLPLRCLYCTCNLGPALLLHHRQPCGLYFAKLDRSAGAAGREGKSAASLLVHGGTRHDLFAIDSRSNFAPFGHLGQHLPTALILAHIGGAFAVTVALGASVLTVLRRHKGESFLTASGQVAL